MDPSGEAAVLIPVKAFAEAKVRLAGVLGAEERSALARSLGAGVIAAAAGLPVWVVCDDREVAEWASGLGAGILWTPARGLNAAVTEGVQHLARFGTAVVIVAHADLPLVGDLSDIGRRDHIVLAPDRRQDGTNVIAIPADSGFRFSYGPGSFGRHLAEAARLGIPVAVLDRPDLAWDVDVPDDLGPLSPDPPSAR
ncbi:MAG TPA: 2-phospho-L-lactate guanylyltransferase [Acidimicrobiales bacterium]|nr:2-phospho-L-lactate guanylyltransferase [Acidimicrobiales bacterium]